jgi:flavorubredoxin
MAEISEIGPDIYRISVYLPAINLQFNHFLVKDDEPLLFHTGYRAWFAEARDAAARLIEPSKLRWISFSHFESDECGSLNDWLGWAPRAQAAASDLGVLVSLGDFAVREPRGLADGEILQTGQRRFRLVRTPHLPHGWDAAVLFEETSGTLFCSDLFHQTGNVEPLVTAGLLDRTRGALTEYQAGILAEYSPYTPYTDELFAKLAALKPKRLAVQHGSSFEGDGKRAIEELGRVFQEIFGRR